MTQTWVYRHREETSDMDSASSWRGGTVPDELFGHLLTPPEDVLTFRRILLAA
ncbi:MAG: hypothetical protein IPK12_22505 [Gemmatimonadetes bacterium]|nr:hypothetical protein [Gemmatimonadota bacterium]